MHYYKFNISDWALHTAHLSLEEEAVYFRLMNHYYDSENLIPKENLTDTNMVSREFSTLVRRLRLTSHYDVVIRILQEFFIETEQGWSHKRCDDELAAFHAKAERNREVGKLGGRPKKNPEITQMVSKDNPTETLTTNYKLQTTNQLNTKAHKLATPEGVSDIVFKDFIALRNKLKAPVTETAIKGLKREAERAKISLEEALSICCQRGWRGFKAEWVAKDDFTPTRDKPTQRWDASLQGVMEKGKELGILPRPGETEGEYRDRIKRGI